MNDHYTQTLDLFHSAASDAPLAFGHSAIVDIDKDKKTIRQMSVDLCGNEGLEDRISRWVEAARWDNLIKLDNGQLYEEARTWLTVSHFTVLYRYFIRTEDYEAARDLQEMCFIRTIAEGTIEVRPVEWLRGRASDPGLPTTPVLRHRFWKLAMKLLGDMQGELARKGKEATKQERRLTRLLVMMVSMFNAEKQS